MNLFYRHKTDFVKLFVGVWCGLSCLVLAGNVSAAEEKVEQAEQLRFFESKIRPLLSKHCYECHSGKEQKGELRVDHLSFLKTGGESGAALEPGKPDESLLIEAVRYEGFEMPPEQQLSEHEIKLLEKWVEDGAYWPEEKLPTAKDQLITEEDRQWWAYLPLAKPAVPMAKQYANPIDAFVAKRHKENKLSSAPQAERATLIRRAYYDLHGLPPSPEEVIAFVKNDDPQAYEKLIDQLLEAPQYGEQWARHWLDVVRYAESDGWRKDDYRPDAWRYRDYIVQSFNADKPYDQFVKEQLAGDELSPEDPQAVAATGFLRLGIYEYNQRDAETQWHNIVDEMTDVTSDVFLATGLACARCHHHKFDPLLQDDYYNLRSFFEPLVWRDDVPFATEEELQQYTQKLKKWEQVTEKIRAEMFEIEKPYREARAESAVKLFPLVVQAAYRKPAAERTSYEEQLAYLVERQAIDKVNQVNWKNLKGDKLKNWNRLNAELKKHEKLKPAPLFKMSSVSDAPGKVSETKIRDKRKSPVFTPAYLQVLGGEKANPSTPAKAKHSSGRRTALAEWVTRKENPLTARVIVSRIWQYHFGRGIVATSNDFGKLGTKPTHPQLLDWLASSLVENGFQLKQLHRQIMLSETYKQSISHPQAKENELIDPENHFVWRTRIRRLSAEEIRDSMLVMTGELDRKLGGAGLKEPHKRRSLYSRAMRNKPAPFLKTMGSPDGIKSAPVRYIATTAPQALLMMNGSFTFQRAQKLADKLAHFKSDEEFINQLFLVTTGAKPTELQHQQASLFLEAEKKEQAAANRVDFCHIMLNSNQFLYLE